MPQKIVKFEGRTLSVPNDATPDEIDAIFNPSRKTEDTAAILKDQAARFPTRPVTGVDSGEGMTAWDTAKDQAVSAVEGAANLPRSLFDTIRSVGGAMLEPRKIPELAQGLVASIVEPVKTLGRNYQGLAEAYGATVPDSSIRPATTEENRGMAEAGGANLAATVLPAIAGRASGVVKAGGPSEALFNAARNRMPTSKSLNARATANRAVGGNVIDDVAKSGSSVGATLKLGRNLYSKAAAPIQEAVANKLDRIAGVETAEQLYARQQLQRNAELPPSPDTSAPVNIPKPQESLFQREIERWRGLETPEQLYARQQAQRNAEFTPADVPEEKIGIPRPAPGEIPRATVPANTLAQIEEAIAPTTNKARKFSQMTNSAGEITKFGEDLPRIVPDIVAATKETAPGILKRAITEMEAGIEAAEAKIPPETPIAAEPIADKIASIIEDFAGDERSVMQLTREWERWAGQKSLPWEEFRTVKRNIGKNLTTPAMKRMYRVLVEANNEVSKELGIANHNYSVVRRAMENGGIDIQTGRRVSTVAKPPK